MSHVEHVSCMRHLTHRRAEGMQRGDLPELLTASEELFPPYLAGQCISLFMYRSSHYVYPNLYLSRLLSMWLVWLLWMALPVWPLKPAAHAAPALAAVTAVCLLFVTPLGFCALQTWMWQRGAREHECKAMDKIMKSHGHLTKFTVL